MKIKVTLPDLNLEVTERLCKLGRTLSSLTGNYLS